MKIKLKEIKQEDMVNSIFTKIPFETVSKKYVHIPTYTLIKDMEKLGWVVVETKQSKIKNTRKNGYQKHIVKFYNPDITIQGENGDDVFPQIILINSHDGTSSFQFRIGLYRLICTNGLVIATTEFGNVSIRHFGYSFEELRKTVTNLTEKLPNIVVKINTFRDCTLSDDQIKEFALNAAIARFGDKLKNGEAEIDIDELLKAKRKEDEGNSLWNVFNRIQEKLINGGFKLTNSETEKTRKVRSVKSFITNLKLNEDLWTLAESYAS